MIDSYVTYIKLATLGSFIGYGLLSTIGNIFVNSVCTYTKKSIISEHFTSYDKILDYVKETDLLNRINKIEILLDEIKTKEMKKSINETIVDLESIIYELKINIKTIQDKNDYEKTLYFKEWRKSNCVQLEEQFKTMLNILDNRFKIFLDIYSIYK